VTAAPRPWRYLIFRPYHHWHLPPERDAQKT